MKINRTLFLAAWLGLGGIGFLASSASALPMYGMDPALAVPTEAGQGVENARWICGPYGGCRWVRGWRYWRPYYGYYYRPWWWRRYYW